jgi:acyl-CoA synthetase (AMP-forming)/AMP-acid ligase II
MTRLTDLLAEREGDAETLAVYCGGRSVTRTQLRESAQELAATLQGLGLTAGQPVAVMLPNGPEVVAAMFGTWLAGGVYVPLNPRLADREIQHYIESVRPAAVVAAEGAGNRFGDLPVIAASDMTWQAPVARAADVPTHEADIALVQFTSGTTGRPKPVLLRHSGFLALLEPVLRKLLGANRDAVTERKTPMPNLIPTSMALSAGIYNTLFAFSVGAPVVIMEKFTTKDFAELIDKFAIRSTVLPPAAMTMLVDDPETASIEPLKFVRSISSPLSPLQARRFKDKFGVMVLNCYGQTEIGGEIVGWNAADAREFGETHLGAVGRAHEGVTLRIVGPDGTELDTNEQGELFVRTPAVSAGYADGADLGDRLTPDGWFRTGDIARVDPQGFLWIEGRVSDMINRGGNKVFPGEVEEVVRLSPDVAECAVAGVPDDRLGEVPWAFVVLAPGATLDPDALTAVCRAELAPYKIPVRFVAVDALPRNEAGKVLTRQLIDRADQAAR